MNYILLLGNSNPEVCYKRCEIAAQHFKQLSLVQGVSENYIHIICCGYHSPNLHETLSEAEFMQNILTDVFHISPKHITLEPESHNTEENLLNCRKLLCNYKLLNSPDKHIKSIIICTSSFHIKRAYVLALYIFQKDNVEIKAIHTIEDVIKELKAQEMMTLDWQLGNIIRNSK